MRKKLIAGNWKMNNTNAQAVLLCKKLRELIIDPKCDIAVCVPFTAISAVKRELEGSVIRIGAQNISWADKGAFTGEISADMLLEIGTEYVITGHSERRAMFGDTDEIVFKRAKQAINKGLIPIVCIGETKEEREQNLMEKVLEKQIRGSLGGFTPEEIKRLVVAYEPVWAIGTGLTATDEQAESAVFFVRKELDRLFRVGENVRILYGGSMNAKNASGLLSMKNIDGGLIGGASLVAEDFVRIIESC